MHLSDDAKNFTKYIFHTNCDDAQTDQNLVWSYFPQINVSGKQNPKQKNVVKRGMYPMRRLILVFAIRTSYKCHFSCTYRRLNAIMFYVHFLKKMSIIYHWN